MLRLVRPHGPLAHVVQALWLYRGEPPAHTTDLRRALRRIDDARAVGWAAFALDRGYCDQAHFVEEFGAHAGLTPSQYVARRGPFLNHVPA